MSIFSAIKTFLLGGAAGGVSEVEPAGDFRPPICAACGAQGPVSAEPCSRCGIPGTAFVWKREPPARGRPVTWTTVEASLGVEARVHPMNDGTWWGSGRHVKGFTLPTGGPWAAVDERNPDAMKAFCAWLLPNRPELHWPDTVSARCTLLALSLAGLGAIELRLVRAHSWGDSRSGAPEWLPDARVLTNSGVQLPWARKSLELLTQRCDIRRARTASTTEWLDAVLHFGPIPERDPVPAGVQLEPSSFPTDPDIHQLARMIHVGLAIFQDP